MKTKSTNYIHLINILFLIFVTIGLCLILFDDNIFIGHDLRFHMNRIVGLKEAFQDHQFLPKIYPYTNNGYGYASPLFYCDIFLYPFAILYYLGLPLVIDYKIVLITYSFLASLSSFYALKKIFIKNRLTPYIGTMLYMFCNYHIYDLHVRSALGELFAMVFIPLVLYAIYKILVLKEDSWILLGVSFSLLLMSHLISFVLYCILFLILIVFFIFKNKDDIKVIKRASLTVLKAIAIALLLSIWYILPMFEQFFDQTFWANEINKLYDLSNSVSSISSMFNPFTNIEDGSYSVFDVISVGWILLFGQFIYLFIKKNQIITILMVIADVVLLATIGIIPLYGIELFSFLQFTFRLYLLAFPILVIVLSYCVDNLSNKFANIFLIIICAYSMINMVVLTESIYQKEDYYFIDNHTSREEIYNINNVRTDYNNIEISGAEYLPFITTNDYIRETTFIKQINDDGQYEDLIYDYDRKFTEISFTFNFDEDKLLMLPQSYYKGYQAYEIIDGKEVKIDTFNIDRYKKLGFNATKGEHSYISRYKGTTIQNVSLAISSFSLVYLIIRLRKR